jgi:hypothetical protein
MGTADSSGWSSPEDDELLEAERFQATLDGLPVTDPEMQDLVGLARHLGEIPATDPNASADPTFVSQLREQLLDEEPALPTTLQAVGAANTHRRHRGRSPRLVVAALTAALIFTLASAGVATAAQNAEPGSALYPVKTGLEELQVEITQSPGARGRTELSFAALRLQELRTLIKRVDTPTSTLRSTIEAFSVLAKSGTESLMHSYRASASRDDIFTIRAFVDNALVALHQIDSTGVPTPIKALVSENVDILVEMSTAAHTLCSGCTPAASPTGMPVPTDSPADAEE